MNGVEALMAILGLVTVAGVGGVWIRLGTVIEKAGQNERRTDRVEARVSSLEKTVWNMKGT